MHALGKDNPIPLESWPDSGLQLNLQVHWPGSSRYVLRHLRELPLFCPRVSHPRLEPGIEKAFPEIYHIADPKVVLRPEFCGIIDPCILVSLQRAEDTYVHCRIPELGSYEHARRAAGRYLRDFSKVLVLEPGVCYLLYYLEPYIVCHG